MTGELAWSTPEQIAKRYQLSRKAIYRAIERGDLHAHRLCGRLRINTQDEHHWLTANAVTHTPAVDERRNSMPREAVAAADQGSVHSLRALHAQTLGLPAEQSYTRTPPTHTP